MKYEEVYLHAYETISAAKAGLSWINTFASTTAAALTRALTGKHRISVTTIRCLYPWRPTPRAAYTQGSLHPGQVSAYRIGLSVQSNGTSYHLLRIASPYGRCGYLRGHALSLAEGWSGSHGPVIRIWRRHRLKVPFRQPTRRRLWL